MNTRFKHFSTAAWRRPLGLFLSALLLMALSGCEDWADVGRSHWNGDYSGDAYLIPGHDHLFEATATVHGIGEQANSFGIGGLDCQFSSSTSLSFSVDRFYESGEYWRGDGRFDSDNHDLILNLYLDDDPSMKIRYELMQD